MPSDDLEFPASADDLYLARGVEVSAARPLMQGDVLEDVELPGIDDGHGKAAILTHPCSMRRGSRLADRLLVGRVGTTTPLALEAWATGHIRVMPLPELDPNAPQQSYAASFENVSSAASTDLVGKQRIACLSDHGIALLEQRYVFYLTRFVVPSEQLHMVCAPVLAECELQEEWMGRSAISNVPREAAEEAFHEFIRAPREGRESLQEALEEASKRGFVVKEVRGEMNTRFGPE